MQASVRGSDLIRILVAGFLMLLVSGAATADAPKRVVSLNVCTDQLAMLLAEDGQLYSVSHLAIDPRVSAMAEEAREHLINHARAEEIFLMKPDMVLAGTYTAQATVAMLRKFDIPVATFAPATSVEEVSAQVARMGDALGREDAAQALIEDFEARLAALRAEVSARPDAALYFANGYTTGDNTLAGQILAAAGFSNIAKDAGIANGGNMPLEILVMSDPDLIVTGETYPGASRAEAILAHPVVRDLAQRTTTGTITNRDWICGTPFVLRAIDGLAELRRDLERE